MFYLFDALILHILMYGSDILGYNRSGTQVFDKLFQNFVRCTLHIKATTCNPIVYSECGRFQPIVYCHINVPKYRVALSKLRPSSHNLEIERGRYVWPKKILDERVCILCKVVDDKIHFVTSCCANETERLSLYQKLITVDPEFTLLSNEDKFVYLMANRNQTVITWFAKCIYHSFHARNEKVYMPHV